MKDTILVYTSYLKKFEKLNDEQFGQLIRASLSYVESEEVPEIDDIAVAISFDVMKVEIDLNNQKYEEKCRKNRENGRKGGQAKASKNSDCYQMLPNASERYQTLPNDSEHYQSLANAKISSLNDNDNDNDNDLNNISSISSDIDSSDLDQSDMPASKDKELVEELNAEVEEIHVKQVVAEFNRVCTELPKVSKISVQRTRKVKSRLKAFKVDEIFKAFEIASQSKFLNGYNDTGWNATFDWFFENDTNITKVLEGNYNNKSSPKGKSGFNGFSQREYDMKELEKKMFSG